MTQDELSILLNEHKKWLVDHDTGTRIDLKYAELRNLDLTNANLTNANLINTSLTKANLTNANLTKTNLTNSNLIRANLTGTNLTGANLTGVTGNGKEIRTFATDTHPVIYTKDMMYIGCQKHYINKWYNLSDRQLLQRIGKEELKSWNKWKHLIKRDMEKINAF